jgi:hypothetical protein
MNEIDELLSRPLPAVDDDGFSRRVMRRVRADERRRWFVLAAATTACIVLALQILPMQSIAVGLNLAITQAASSLAVSIAAAAIILTLLLERHLGRF